MNNISYQPSQYCQLDFELVQALDNMYAAVLVGHFLSLQKNCFDNKPFFQQRERIINTCKINSFALRTAIKLLQQVGILEVSKKGSLNYYFINEQNIIKILQTGSVSTPITNENIQQTGSDSTPNQVNKPDHTGSISKPYIIIKNYKEYTNKEKNKEYTNKEKNKEYTNKENNLLIKNSLNKKNDNLNWVENLRKGKKYSIFSTQYTGYTYDKNNNSSTVVKELPIEESSSELINGENFLTLLKLQNTYNHNTSTEGVKSTTNIPLSTVTITPEGELKMSDYKTMRMSDMDTYQQRNDTRSRALREMAEDPFWNFTPKEVITREQEIRNFITELGPSTKSTQQFEYAHSEQQVETKSSDNWAAEYIRSRTKEAMF